METDQPVLEAAPPAEKSPDWLARIGWAVLALVVIVGVLAATIGWDTTASATVVRRCEQWVRADGQTLYRATVTVPGRTIPAAQAASVPAFAVPRGSVRLSSGAIRLPSTQEYPDFPAGHRVEVHHRLLRRDTYTFLPDHGAGIRVGTTGAVACTGGA